MISDLRNSCLEEYKLEIEGSLLLKIMYIKVCLHTTIYEDQFILMALASGNRIRENYCYYYDINISHNILYSLLPDMVKLDM